MHFSGRTMGVREYITWWITSSLRQTRPRARHAENTKVDFRPRSIQRMTCKDQPRSLYAHHSFVQGLIDNAIYRWLKELGNISSCAGNLHRWILYRSGNAEKHYWPWICKYFDFGHLTGIECTIITVWSSIGARSLEKILTFRIYHCMSFPSRMRAHCEHQLVPRTVINCLSIC